MRTRHKWLLGGFVTIAVAVSLVLFNWEREPSYEGRQLSGWLAFAKGTPDQQLQAQAAITKIGTNGIPFLLKWIEHRPSNWSWKDRVSRLRKGRFYRWIPAWAKGETEDDRADAAPAAFRVLGPTAVAAIPQLMTIAINSEGRSGQQACEALGAIGTIALPALVEIITNKPISTTRGAAIYYIGTLGTNAAPAVAALLACLQGDNIHTVREAVIALGQIKARADLVVPALTSLLEKTPIFPDTTVSESDRGYFHYQVAYAIGEFGEAAHTAVPALIRGLTTKTANDSLACQLMKALSSVTDHPEVALPPLIQNLEGTNALRRHCAARALAELGGCAHDALPALTNALQYEDTRKMATIAITVICSDVRTNAPAH